MNCVGHIQHGMWTHPRDRSINTKRGNIGKNLARIAERGLFNGIFLADIVGAYDAYKDSPAASIINAAQIPINDPMMVAPAMATVTSNIGFGAAGDLTYEPPYLFSSPASALDYLMGGSFGWNIITGYLDSAGAEHGKRRRNQ
jgi:alkanesulfonate monooxygenase SsuD/methylene tetrahydromethanopterin reductase-like flavin-dependent oxidoreductase (luciferase family)